MTRERVRKVLERPQYDLKKIFYDEALKLEKSAERAKILADEVFLDLKLHLERIQ